MGHTYCIATLFIRYGHPTIVPVCYQSVHHLSFSLNQPEDPSVDEQNKKRLTTPVKERVSDKIQVPVKKYPTVSAPYQVPDSQSVEEVSISPVTPQLRYRSNAAPNEPTKTVVAPSFSVAVVKPPSPTSNVPSNSPVKGKIAKSPATESDGNINYVTRLSTDNNTGAREQVQSTSEDGTNMVEPPSVLMLAMNKPKGDESLAVEKAIVKPSLETASKQLPPDVSATTGVLSQSTSKKSKGTRKVILVTHKSPSEYSPLPSDSVKQLERKGSESSINSTNSDSSTEKSELESPLNQVSNLAPEPKIEKPLPFTKEPNTGQTFHPAESSDMVDAVKPEQHIEPQKKETPPTVRVKGKRKLRQQQRREEKARRRDRDKDREIEKPETERSGKLSSSGSVDNLLSTSTEQIDEELALPDECQKETMSTSNNKVSSSDAKVDRPDVKSSSSVDGDISASFNRPIKELEADLEEVGIVKDPLSETKTELSSEGSVSPPLSPVNASSVVPSEGSVSPPPSYSPTATTSAVSSSRVPAANTVPGTAIKTNRSKNSKHQTKEPVPDPFSRLPDRSTYNSKKVATKKTPEKTTTKGSLSPVSEKNTSPLAVSELFAFQIETEKAQLKQRPQTLPVIKAELYDNEPVGVFMDSGSVEADGVSHMLQVDKSTSQSLPTSPHELAASLLSKNSAMKRRKLKSDVLEDSVEEDEEEEGIGPESKEAEVSVSENARRRHSSQTSTTQKDGPSSLASPNQFKPLSTPLSLNAEPFYPSQTFQPVSNPSQQMVDPRKYVERVQIHPPGFSPTPEDVFVTATPYPEQQFSKRERRAPHHRVVKSITPSPPPLVSFHSFPDGKHMPFMDYPGPQDQHDSLGYLGIDEQSAVPDEVSFMSGSMGGGRYNERYREQIVTDSHVIPKGDHGRAVRVPSNALTDNHMAHLHQQDVAQYSRVARDPHSSGHSGRGSLWDQPTPYRVPPPPLTEEPMTRQYLRKRQYILSLVKREREAMLAREQARRSAEAISSMSQLPQKRGHGSGFGPSSHSSSLGQSMWDDMEPLGGDQFNSPSMPSDELSVTESMLAHQIQQRQQLLQEQLSPRPVRSRTYSTESDLGGEFVSDLETQYPSPTLGAPGQPFSSRSSKNLAPGRSRSSGWPGDTQVSFIFCCMYSSF